MSALPSPVQVCIICLDTDSKLYVMNKYKLGKAYENLTGHSLSDEEQLTKFLCSECIHRLVSFSKFRYKSLRARSAMEDVVRQYKVITLQHIKLIDRNIYQLQSNIVKTVLAPNHCDFYIDHSAHNTVGAVAGNIDGSQDSMADDGRNMEMMSEGGNNANGHTELDREFGNNIVKTEQNLYDDHIEIKSEVIGYNDFCDDDIEFNDDYLPDSTLVLQSQANFEEDSLINEAQKYCIDYTHNLDIKTENVKTANEEHKKEKDNCRMEMHNIRSDKKSSKRKNKLQDKLRFETNIENSNSLKIGRSHRIQKSNYDSDKNSLLVKREKERKSTKRTEVNPYSCNKCDYKCKLKISLTVHMKRAHASDNSFSCALCSYKCKLRHTLNVHMKQHTEEKPYACELCKYKFTLKSKLISHMKTHKGEKSFSCKLCSYKCKLRHNLNVHMIKHTEEKSFACDVCDSKFKFKSNLLRHMRAHTCPPLSCNMCDYKTVHKYYLKVHLRGHDKSYACQLCPNKYVNKSGLKNHLSVHRDQIRLTCKLCQCEFKNAADLKMHRRNHHSDSPTGKGVYKPYACQLCKSKFKQRHHLENHMCTHSGEKPFQCLICEQRFTQKVSLKKHMALHNGEKLFACNTCPYNSLYKIDLARHMRIHTGEKPYACTYCDFRSCTSYSLLTHTRCHTGEKPFSCKICDYKCSRSSELVRHMGTHNGEKRFSCKLCDYKCTRHCNLQSHMRIHTGEMFSCDYCEYRTANKSCLVVHIVRHMALIREGKVRTRK